MILNHSTPIKKQRMSQQTALQSTRTSYNILVLHTQKQYEHGSKQVTQEALLVTMSSISDTVDLLRRQTARAG
jgi:hypothetical protein